MKKVIGLLLLTTLLGCQGNKNEKELRYVEGNAFGSTYNIQYYSNKDLSSQVKQALEMFNNAISTYDENSNISKFNRSEKGMKADSLERDLWTKSLAFHKKTNGYFDPTVQPLSSLYGFKTIKIHNKPTQRQIDSVLDFVGMDKAYLSHDSIVKKDPRLELSYNAITGYVNDYVASKFDKEELDSYLIEIGGEVSAKGAKADGTNWVVGIDVPNDELEQREIFAAVELKDESLATSGNYRKFYLLDNGEKVVHTMNPKTGETGVSKLLSATVLASTCAEADATATALMAMGLDKAKLFAEKNKDLKILLIWAKENGEYSQEMFNGFRQLRVDGNS